MHVNVRNLREDDLEEADTILRLSFGTFMGLDNPMSFFGDADYVRSIQIYHRPKLCICNRG